MMRKSKKCSYTTFIVKAMTDTVVNLMMVIAMHMVVVTREPKENRAKLTILQRMRMMTLSKRRKKKRPRLTRRRPSKSKPMKRRRQKKKRKQLYNKMMKCIQTRTKIFNLRARVQRPRRPRARRMTKRREALKMSGMTSLTPSPKIRTLYRIPSRNLITLTNCMARTIRMRANSQRCL